MVIYCNDCGESVRLSEDGFCLSCGRHAEHIGPIHVIDTASVETLGDAIELHEELIKAKNVGMWYVKDIGLYKGRTFTISEAIQFFDVNDTTVTCEG